MKLFWLGLAAILIGACASDGYRYHQDGYWDGARRSRTSIVVYGGYGGGCSRWISPLGYGPAWYPWHPCFGGGYAYHPYYGNGFYALYDPFWPYGYGRPYRYGAPTQGASLERAEDEARRLSGNLGDGSQRGFPRYEDLGPLRRRDLGVGGGDMNRSAGYWQGRTGSSTGLSSGQNRAGGIGGAGRSNGGSSNSRSEGSRASSGSRSSRTETNPSRSRDSEE